MLNLQELNSLPDDQAEKVLLQCFGCNRWSTLATKARPFSHWEDLLSKVEQIEQQLTQQDWLEGFRSHPRIGEKRSDPSTHAQWSTEEQSASRMDHATFQQELYEANRDYENTFGYLFIVCATGLTTQRVLQNLRTRLNHSPEQEWAVAIEEQKKITRLRLEKLLCHTLP